MEQHNEAWGEAQAAYAAAYGEYVGAWREILQEETKLDSFQKKVWTARGWTRVGSAGC